MHDVADVQAARASLVTEWHYDLLRQATTLVLALIASGLAKYGGRV